VFDQLDPTGTMRRIAAASVLVVAACALLVVGLGARGGGPTPYSVRAIFDNASAVVTGEDVRIAGAPVGTIAAEDVTRDKQAALTLQINNSAFVPWHANASCQIRVQSVIGEKFVDCNPGTSKYPRLTRIDHGPGTGSYYLPVSRTKSPVDFDIVQNISRLPVRQQFALILNELGTGLAARGSDLNAVIRRADPALGYTDRVLKILARQNHQLAQLATNSNTVLGALARVKHQLTGFIQQANTTSVASAARATDEARSFHLLPGFLRQLQPLERDLGALADQGTPLFNGLSQAAPGINSQYQQLAPFARATRTALISLGRSAVQQQPALLGTIPLDRRLRRLGKHTAPAATLLDRLLSSIQKTGGIQNLMKLLFNGTGATNGFDADGHYIRTQALFGSCTAYAIVPVPGCSANFLHFSAADALSHDRSVLAVAKRSVKQTANSRSSSSAFGSLANYLLGGGR
jgi:phospholipid/cholesterol/gamma-HCH transport system substrate-binding protein